MLLSACAKRAVKWCVWLFSLLVLDLRTVMLPEFLEFEGVFGASAPSSRIALDSGTHYRKEKLECTAKHALCFCR
jgi:hypothetical protein